MRKRGKYDKPTSQMSDVEELRQTILRLGGVVQNAVRETVHQGGESAVGVTHRQALVSLYPLYTQRFSLTIRA